MNAVAVAVPNIPREDWTAHPRFRTQALLLGSHANFRRVSRYLVDQAARELHARADEVAKSFRSLARPADPSGSTESPTDNPVLRALQAHDLTLDAHLNVEEEAVIPLLLALDPAEFDRYYRSPLSMLIPAARR
jgi:hypothetical protein